MTAENIECSFLLMFATFVEISLLDCHAEIRRAVKIILKGHLHFADCF
jgi:hypothetical protein